MRFPLVAVAALAFAGAGCLHRVPRCTQAAAVAGAHLTCELPGYVDRSFELLVPDGWDGHSHLPVVLAIHGGGGNRAAALRTTCPTGVVGEAGCLSQVALAQGFAVVSPDGTGARPLTNVRTWNAGGGTPGSDCTSGAACREGVDDVAFFRALLDEVGLLVPVDDKRVFATGLSNGGAMSHRLACQLSDRIAAVAPVGGANQLAATGGACEARVPVLHIHGTEDPCWTFERSTRACIETRYGGWKVGVMESMEGWRVRNGCSAESPTETLLPDVDPTDGTRVTRLEWKGCAADTVLLRVDGGGHTWPNGYPYFGEDVVGRVGRDLTSDVIVEFFRAHPKP